MRKERKKIIEEVLRNRVLDITDEYRGRKQEKGVSVFLGYPEKIIEELKNRLKSIRKMSKVKMAQIVYEATRLEAEWSKRSIVPEKWESRDEKFRNQFIDVIDKYLLLEKLPTPEEAHNSWMKSYFEMGWKYGEKRNLEKKTHTDLLPFDKLPKDERDKDAIFLAIVWAIKNLILII